MIWDIAAGLAIPIAAGLQASIKPAAKDNVFCVTVGNGNFDPNG